MLPIVEKYFILTKKFRDQYGKNTVIFIQEGDSYKVFGYYLHDEQIKVCENIIHLHVKKEDSLFTSEFYYNMHKYYEKTILSNDYTIVYVDEVKTSLPCEERWKVREIRSFSEVHADNQCDVCTFLYASCCPSIFATNLRPFT